MSRTRSGFSLVELLVVIGIIILLAGLILPSINRAQLQSEIAAQRVDFTMIGTALELYHKDFRAYPIADPLTAPDTNAHFLVLGLMGPRDAAADGVEGLGFKALKAGSAFQGPQYGPYISTERFRTALSSGSYSLLDRWERAIVYFPANPGVSPTVSIVGAAKPTCFYLASPAVQGVLSDSSNAATLESQTQAYLQSVMGDQGGANRNRIDGSETVLFSAPYFLASRGPDTKWTTRTGSANAIREKVDENDDVWNVDK